jgi:short-subunit dehydrogenase
MSAADKTVLILGGSSDIARATARLFAIRGWQFQLAGRDLEALRREIDDIKARTGVAGSSHHFDVLDSASFASFADSLPSIPNVVISVVGLLGEKRRAEVDLLYAAIIMRSNYEGPALILGLFAERFLARGNGTIVGVSSVAGDRGRASNYVYGSAKAGLTAFLSGLRNRTARQGIHVITVKPGFVRTRMTAGMKLPGLLTAEPTEVAEAIWRGVTKGDEVIYVRSIWRLVMKVIGLIPESIFKRLSL